MLTAHQSREAETEPLESDYWQSRTESLDSEHWEPFWAARIVFIGGIVLFDAVIICIIAMPLIWPNEGRQVVAADNASAFTKQMEALEAAETNLDQADRALPSPRLRTRRYTATITIGAAFLASVASFVGALRSHQRSKPSAAAINAPAP